MLYKEIIKEIYKILKEKTDKKIIVLPVSFWNIKSDPHESKTLSHFKIEYFMYFGGKNSSPCISFLF